ncbi:MAG: hypothetical protein LBS61_03275 [Endomicrobium sp.]|nr:hypothetical protein [Endomicrobium sp.]
MYFNNSSVTFLRNAADTASEAARADRPLGYPVLGIGWAISIKKTSSNIYFQGATQVEFISNTARNGGAIYVAGTIDFECSSVTFRGNVATSSGGAIFVSKEDFYGRTTLFR